MNSKFEYEFDQQLEKPSFTKIQMKAMEIWRETQEGTELFNKVQELITIIEQEQNKLEDIRSIVYLIASKL